MRIGIRIGREEADGKRADRIGKKTNSPMEKLDERFLLPSLSSPHFVLGTLRSRRFQSRGEGMQQ